MVNDINDPIQRSRAGLRVGTVIVKTWHDTKYEVRVCKEGFEWNGQCYNTLSAIARTITGAQRSGYDFFGIKDKING